MLRAIQFSTGLILLIALEILRVYFIMPFPGSQRTEAVHMAYFIHSNVSYFRVIGLLIILFPVLYFFWMGKTPAKVFVAIGLLTYGIIFYLFNFKFLADKIFHEPQHKIFASAPANAVPAKNLVLGIYINGEARAYPVEIIGYHHQVGDTVGDQPVMVTYCTVCRTGRVYSPIVEGRAEKFRLVGMDQFNAMFEDETTGSWWRQINGEAIVGPSKGKILNEIPSEQMTLGAWLDRNPNSLILQPDSTYKDRYENLKKYDEGTIESDLVGRDSLSWKDKSWVVGVQVGRAARAYDWNHLIDKRVINDTLGGVSIVVLIGADSTSFHVWRRDSLTLSIDQQGFLRDTETNSTWSWHGKAVDGPLKDKRLTAIQAYQQFWHAWKTFHQTSQYPPSKTTMFE